MFKCVHIALLVRGGQLGGWVWFLLRNFEGNERILKELKVFLGTGKIL